MELEDVDEDGEQEHACGAFPRLVRLDEQSREKAWRTQSLRAFPEVDGELDDCDREDADPDEAKQQPPEMTPCA